MSFGKRPSRTAAQPVAAPPAPPPPPAADPHGRRKVFADEVWQGPSGDLLRDMGMSPNDENNLVANTASINARIDAGRAALDARLAQANANVQARLAGAELRPFSLLPDPCWNGDNGLFLMASLDLYPYDDWNIVFLAADQRTATTLDIALHPNGNVPAFVAAADKFMASAQAHLKRAMDEVELTQNYAGFHDAREDIQLRVKGLAMTFARALIEAWDTNQNADVSLPRSPEAAKPTRLEDEDEPRGLHALADEIREEAEATAKVTAFSAARNLLGWGKS